MSNRHEQDSSFDTHIRDLTASVAAVSQHILSFPISLLRSFTPQFLTVLTLLAILPLLAFFSASAGWLVWKSVAISWESELFLSYGDGRPPYADVIIPQLHAEQPYDIFLHLHVPLSDTNMALGNFMASLELTTTSNRSITSARKPSILMRPSRLQSFLSASSNTQEIVVPLLSSSVPGSSRIRAHVEVGRRDHWRDVGDGTGKELSVVSASLRGSVIPSGIRGVITRFPLISSLIASIAFFVASSLALLLCLLPLFRFQLPPLQPTGPPLSTAPSGSHSVKEGERLHVRSRRASSASVGGSGQMTSVRVLQMSDSISTADPLRRRRSQVNPLPED